MDKIYIKYYNEKALHPDILKSLIGKKIINIRQTYKGDEGFEMFLEGGSNLCVAFSGCEGTVYFNGEPVNTDYEKEKYLGERNGTNS